MERVFDDMVAVRDQRTNEPDHDAIAYVDGGQISAAVQLLMKRHGASVYRYCRTALHDPVLADDVLQQVFIEVFRDLPQFARRSSVRAWIIGIAHHRVLDAAKARRRTASRLTPVVPDDVVALEPNVDEVLDELRLTEAMTTVIVALDIDLRTALLLRYQQGMTYEQMAAICHATPGALQARVKRVLPRLRALIDRRIRSGGSTELGDTAPKVSRLDERDTRV